MVLRRGGWWRWVVVVGAVAAVIVESRRTQVAEPKRPAASLCRIEPLDGEAAIMATIASCPNGSTVRFPPNAQYHQNNKILIADRHDLTIDGNGSTFTTTATRASEGVNGNWVILRGSNITLEHMSAVGAFNLDPPRTFAKYPSGVSEAHMNYGVYGAEAVHLTDLKGSRPWGDGVTIAPDGYIDGSVPSANWKYAGNVYVTGVQIEHAARVCFAPTSGVNIWIQDSSCKDSWAQALDAEVDTPGEPLQGLHVLRNTFDGYTQGAIFVPIAGDPGKVKDIEIRGNKLISGPDNLCNPSILMNAYPASTNRMQNVVVEDNDVWALTRAVQYDHVDGGSIHGNTIHPLPAPTGYDANGWCGEVRQTIVDDSTNVAASSGPR